MGKKAKTVAVKGSLRKIKGRKAQVKVKAHRRRI
jgi:hypothetical protein